MVKLVLGKKGDKGLPHSGAINVKCAANPVSANARDPMTGAIDKNCLVVCQDGEVNGEPGFLHQRVEERFGNIAQIQIFEDLPTELDQIDAEVIVACLGVLLEVSPIH
jgi:hypothetical protein